MDEKLHPINFLTRLGLGIGGFISLHGFKNTDSSQQKLNQKNGNESD